ncbi:MAG: phosphoribosylformylglycinamidine cyclo-ligase [Leptospiraceae bacterium]|nr:phosphoribosylformylglycinamidine cyclo-ligase [Leptospiraceae bacterium]
MSEESINYRAAGVDTEKGRSFVRRIADVVRSTHHSQVIADRAGFGGLMDVSFLKSYRDPVLVTSTDGVGTKLRLAQLFNRHTTVGIDLVAMCTNDLLASGAQPLQFLDYIACGRLDEQRMYDIVSGIAEGCRRAGCSLMGGETAEHPDTMEPDDYDLAGFAVGVVERSAIIGGSAVAPGDRVIGLPSSGVHSNGMSLVRRLFLKDGLDLPESPADRKFLEHEVLLRPTVIYERALRPLLDKNLPIHAIAHITGGGFYENIPRVLPEGLGVRIDPKAWQAPRVFSEIAKRGVAAREMFSVFNMGIGMILIVPAESVRVILGALDQGLKKLPEASQTWFGGRAFEIGEVVAHPPEPVTFDPPL